MLQLLERDPAVRGLSEWFGGDDAEPTVAAFVDPEASGSAFEAWDARAYLADYYSQVEHDEQLTLAFLVQESSRIAPGATALVFGAGPALHHLLPLAPRVEEIMRPTTCMRISQRFGAGSIASPARMTGGPSRGMCWSAKAMPSRASSISAGVKR